MTTDSDSGAAESGGRGPGPRPGLGLGLVVRGLQFLLVGLVGYALVDGAYPVAVNGALALAVTFLPAALEWRYDHRVDPRLSVWIAVAATLHVGGFFGGYGVQTGPLSWYDQLAHAVSASFVAGVGYALVGALDRSSTRVRFPDGFRFVFTLAFVLAFGVAWEIVEFAGGWASTLVGTEEALVQYGVEDTVLDLTFNTLAAALVALWGTGYFRGVAALFTRGLRGTRES